MCNFLRITVCIYVFIKNMNILPVIDEFALVTAEKVQNLPVIDNFICFCLI